jgi:multiple sugar transport system permease protein
MRLGTAAYTVPNHLKNICCGVIVMKEFFDRYGPLNTFIDKNVKWIFPLPAVLFILIMMAFPVIFTFGVSMTDWSMASGGVSKYIGFENYINMFKDPRFYNALLNTFYFTGLTIVTETLLGVIIALVLNREFIGKNIVKTILILPMVATPVAIGLAWTLFYEPTIGLGNFALKTLGLPASNWLASNTTVIPSIALVDIWQWTPMIALIVLAGLAGLPTDPFESAIVDGAKPHQVLFHITLPLLMPTIMIAVVLRSIEAFKTFDIIYSMTGGGPGYASETLNILAYKQAFGYFKFGAASSTLFALFAIVFGSSVLMLILRRRGSDKI